jgi:hypothetical protein
MPHGWAISEMWLLMRDCLIFEDDNQRLVLLAGMPAEWLRHPDGLHVKGLETYFGTCDFAWIPQSDGAVFRLFGTAAPPNGFALRLPSSLNATVTLSGENLRLACSGDCILPRGTREVYIQFGEAS